MDDDRTQITESARLLLRWSWLIVLVGLVVGGAAYVIADRTLDNESEAVAVVSVSDTVGWPYHFSTRDAYIAAVTEEGYAETAIAASGGQVTTISAAEGPEGGDVRIMITAVGTDSGAAAAAADQVAADLVAAGDVTAPPTLDAQLAALEAEKAAIEEEVAALEADIAAASAQLAEDYDAAADAQFQRALTRVRELEADRIGLEDRATAIRVDAAGYGPEVVHVSVAEVQPITGTSAGAVGAAAGVLAAALVAALVPVLGRRRGRIRSPERVHEVAGAVPVLDLTATPTSTADQEGLLRHTVGGDPSGRWVLISTNGARSPVRGAVEGIADQVIEVPGGAADLPVADLVEARAIVVTAGEHDQLRTLSDSLSRLTGLGLSPSCVVLTPSA